MRQWWYNVRVCMYILATWGENPWNPFHIHWIYPMVKSGEWGIESGGPF